jgi:hypothetical protein
MKLSKRGRFADQYRGNGFFVSWRIARGTLLFAIRPKNWHLYYVRLSLQPWVQRLYVGPFEFELTTLRSRA